MFIITIIKIKIPHVKCCEWMTEYSLGAGVDEAGVTGQDAGAASESLDAEWTEQVNVRPPTGGC